MIAQPLLRNNRFVKITNCLCPDGLRRVAVLGRPRDWFSISAQVQAFGKTVSGLAIAIPAKTGKRDYEFIPHQKNHYIFSNRS